MGSNSSHFPTSLNGWIGQPSYPSVPLIIVHWHYHHIAKVLYVRKWATCGTFSRTIYSISECKICKLAYFLMTQRRMTNQECIYVALHYLPKNYNGSIAQSSRVSLAHTFIKEYIPTSSHMFYILLFFFSLLSHAFCGRYQTFLACHFYSQWDHDC